MKRFLLGAIALLGLTAPVQAQVTIYNNHPMTWQTPTGCNTRFRLGEGSLERGACSRVEVSTASTTHNIRFANQDRFVIYVTSIDSPKHVHAMGFSDEDGTNMLPVSGTCTITKERFVSCAATDGHLRITHVAGFVQGFPEAEAILR